MTGSEYINRLTRGYVLDVADECVRSFGRAPYLIASSHADSASPFVHVVVPCAFMQETVCVRWEACVVGENWTRRLSGKCHVWRPDGVYQMDEHGPLARWWHYHGVAVIEVHAS